MIDGANSTFDVAELIRNTRARRGLTQAQLARRAGTSISTISRIERGVRKPTVDTVDLLLLMMGTPNEGSAGSALAFAHDAVAIRRNLALPMETRLHHACAWNAFAARISGVARQRTGSENSQGPLE